MLPISPCSHVEQCQSSNTLKYTQDGREDGQTFEKLQGACCTTREQSKPLCCWVGCGVLGDVCLMWNFKYGFKQTVSSSSIHAQSPECPIFSRFSGNKGSNLATSSQDLWLVISLSGESSPCAGFIKNAVVGKRHLNQPVFNRALHDMQQIKSECITTYIKQLNNWIAFEGIKH